MRYWFSDFIKEIIEYIKNKTKIGKKHIAMIINLINLIISSVI
jgi:hypothetical protein